MRRTRKKIDNLLGINLDSNGRYIIDITVLDDDAFLSPFCGVAPVISSELATYLDNTIKNVPPKGDVSLYIYSKVENKEKNLKYQEAIKNYYRNEQRQLKRVLLFNQIAAFTMFSIGFMVIAIMIVLSLKNNIKEIWSTILEIIGWVFVWEAVDKFAFERSSLKRALIRSNQFINADVKFVKGE